MVNEKPVVFLYGLRCVMTQNLMTHSDNEVIFWTCSWTYGRKVFSCTGGFSIILYFMERWSKQILHLYNPPVGTSFVISCCMANFCSNHQKRVLEILGMLQLQKIDK